MFILIISRGIPSPQDPQWGCFEKDQAEALASMGHKVVVASVDSRFRLRWRRIGITHSIINGIEYYNSFLIPGALTNLFGRKATTSLRRMQFARIYKLISRAHGKPDIIYGQFFFNSHIALSISQKENIPLVNIEHAARFNKIDIDHLSFIQSKEVYQATAANIAVSQSLRKALNRHFGIDCHVVYNVFGNEFKYLAKTKLSDTIKFITTGSLIHRKGFDMFARAFAKLNLPKDKWMLKIIGEGEEHQRLQQQIDEAGFHDNILLIGSKTKVEIAEMLNDSDVFVLPSRNENFSVAVLEALACGLPVIASICGGIRECINDKNGLLFEVNDVDALAKAIEYMYHHHQEYDRQAIAYDCQARFSSEVIAKQLTEIFEEVINKRAK